MSAACTQHQVRSTTRSRSPRQGGSNPSRSRIHVSAPISAPASLRGYGASYHRETGRIIEGDRDEGDTRESTMVRHVIAHG
ncbi:hypothetical protein NHJ13051_006247 [Beauveria bassiana]